MEKIQSTKPDLAVEGVHDGVHGGGADGGGGVVDLLSGSGDRGGVVDLLSGGWRWRRCG